MWMGSKRNWKRSDRFGMSKAEILQEIPKLSHEERRKIVRLIFQMEREAEVLADCDWLALERFTMLDALDAEG